ncbi:MAG TPA: ribosomal protein S18-alanine N-acetyltransferase [Candidatus Cloacimonadota bacterium]|nr:ribosomal protein S18-alanine N-acetyltransferase [Candidatus Cloacimonadota bacterium]HOD53050.1 ribosomal protein S18-alanine N-acetyltransferase [Candidatus Cloacimonadota bacterium]HPM00900.1 ribosomal protein S18-alanine N-acetyltransferase [Candidatus Cloacimonadota bacterium]
MAYLIRRMSEEDLNEVYSIEMESEHDTWDFEGFKIAFVQDESYVLLDSEGMIIAGFLFGYETADEFSISNIAIRKCYQNKGLAYQFLNHVIMEKKHIKSFFLEVRKSNLPARRLYDKLGFVPLYIRKAYYQSPVEDALVMGLIREEQIISQSQTEKKGL